MRKFIFTILSLFAATISNAQQDFGTSTGNWSGVDGLYLNPANIADSRQKVSFNLFSYSITGDNSLGAINPATGMDTLIDRAFGGNKVYNTTHATTFLNSGNSSTFSMMAPSVEIRVPGIIYTINHRNSIALTTRVRAMNQFTNLDTSLYRALTDSKFVSPSTINTKNFNWTAHLWSEISLTYATVLLESGKSELKAGITLSVLGGVGYASLKGNLSYTSRNDSINASATDLQYSTNQTTKNEFTQGLNSNLLGDFISEKAGFGLGSNIGLVYEYQPHPEKYRYDTNGKKNLVDDSRNRYLFRISASLLDLGSINYTEDNNTMNITGSGIVTRSGLLTNIANYTFFKSYLRNLDSRSKQHFIIDTGTSATKMHMPTTFLLNADYNVYENYYANLAYLANMTSSNNTGTYFSSKFVFTPRFDLRKVSVAIPVTYSELANDVKVGIGVRAGGLTIGSDDMLAILGSKAAHGFNIYAGLHLSGNKYPPTDRKGKVLEAVAEHPPVATWTVIAPSSNTNLTNTNLFVSLMIDSNYHFANVSSVSVHLDNESIPVLAKIKGNMLEFLYPPFIRSGKHTLRIEAKVAELEKAQSTAIDIMIGKNPVIQPVRDSNKKPEQVRLSGSFSIDDRNEMVTGQKADSLRQEPNYTRIVNVDAAASYKDYTMPIKFYATSDDRFASQTRDYFEIGLKNKWMEIDAGDMNPVFDRLVLTGVRVRGIGLTLKKRNTFLKLVYGDMTRPSQGYIQPYNPASGVLPFNLNQAGDSVITPGVYRRTLMGARFESTNKKDLFKFGASLLKVKDDVGSIQYGANPMDNLVVGTDIGLKLFHHAVSLNSGIAASILTSDTGVITSKQLVDSYKVNVPFNPSDVRNVILLNASTVPLNPNSFDFTSIYSTLNYTNKYQTFTLEYKKNGGLYNSLGNPFLLNNYKGVTLGERFTLFKKKVGISGGYGSYSNNLNTESSSTVTTQTYNGNITYNPAMNLPSLLFNYLGQKRTGDSVIAGVPPINVRLNNYVFNASLAREFWNLKHRFRFIYNISNSADKVNSSNSFNSYNWLLGISENFATKFTVNADGGKTIIKGVDGAGTISNITVYDVSMDWQIKPKKYFTSLAVTNNRTMYIPSIYGSTYAPTSDKTYRLSVVARFGYRFYKGMGIDVEGGYQPFKDLTTSLYNYNELYCYIRYTCDLSRLFAPDPQATKK